VMLNVNEDNIDKPYENESNISTFNVYSLNLLLLDKQLVVLSILHAHNSTLHTLHTPSLPQVPHVCSTIGGRSLTFASLTIWNSFS